jgi:Domain of unknown function (DUF4266)
LAHPRSAFGAPPQGGAASGPAKPAPRRPLVAAALLVGLALGGCSSVQPWVKPYERERLSDPIMQFSRAALADKHREHIHNVREGARGATGVQGGGCGCN